MKIFCDFPKYETKASKRGRICTLVTLETFSFGMSRDELISNARSEIFGVFT